MGFIQGELRERRDITNWQGIHFGNTIFVSFFIYFHPYSLITNLIENPTKFPKALIGIDARITKQYG